MKSAELPIIIQGGMGAGVSSWQLARAVAREGHLGVVSGTALDVILARRLQVGDIGGHVRRALNNFPVPDVAKRIIDRYFVPGGKADDKSFRAKPVPAAKPSRHLEDLLVASNFVEVFLAQQGHDNPVGINYLAKIQLPNLPSIYRALPSGVPSILLVAGIPRTIPRLPAPPPPHPAHPLPAALPAAASWHPLVRTTASLPSAAKRSAACWQASPKSRA